MFLELSNLGEESQEMMQNEGASQELIKGRMSQWEQQVQRPWGRNQLATLMKGRERWGWIWSDRDRGREGK